MRPLKSLSFEAVRDLLAGTFKRIPDRRDPKRVSWELEAVLMSAFAMFFFQHPSLLSYQRRLKQKTGQSNLERVFAIEDVPSDTQMREIIDGVPTEPVRRVLPELFERMRRTGWTVRLVTSVNGENYYTMALDGSEYFHSTKIECPGCLRRKDSGGEVHYSHVVVAATLVKAGTHEILPLDVEEVRNEDGQEKQDCEVNAGKRLVKRVREEHRQMKLCVTGDDIYAHEPFVTELRSLRMGFVLVAKPSSHKELFEWVEELDRMGECERGEWEEGPVAKRRYFEYRIARQVPLSQSGKVMVNFVEVWERNRQGKQVYHNSFVTDFAVTRENVAVIVGVGRSRWKIENEHFNVHKNHGYQLEHNFGHGNQTLSMIFYLLNLLAFLTHKILEWGDRLYQQCRSRDSLRGLWEVLRSAFYLIAVGSWNELLQACLNNEGPSP
ncbi:MAG: hypothetical protein L0287_07785 [Anaerolineae bacterium]|nr:hypothetical protein [Anaerolineae bacterium]